MVKHIIYFDFSSTWEGVEERGLFVISRNEGGPSGGGEGG